MQQECRVKSIMTSSSARAVTRPACLFIGALAALLLAACASLPSDAPVIEQLDDETGLTIARLGHPLEVYQETVRRDAESRFGFVGPFETNQMGKREQFLWVALPVASDADTTSPVVLVNGTALALGESGRSAEFAGLRRPPYKIPTPWIAMYYFRIDANTIARLGEARELAVTVTDNTRNGPIAMQYLAQIGDDPRLRAYASRP
jgi:hypothetical protein